MAALSRVSRQILTQNADRDVERLLRKLQTMRADPFAFFRGANALFLSLLPRGNAVFRAPHTLVCGDLHFENFGAFKGDNRLCYFDINDFDEACVAPFTIDIVRFLACIKVAADGLLLDSSQTERLERTFLAAYTAAILDGKPRWMERSLATGVFRKLLRRAMKRTRPELLDRFSTSAGGRRSIRIDGRRTLALQRGEPAHLRRFMRRFSHDAATPSFFRLIDASRRIAGNGSLGLPRYLLLLRGRGSPDGNFALDLKFAARSAVAHWWGGPQPPWSSEAERIVGIQRRMQAIPPAMLAAVTFEKQPFVLKELQPSIDRLDFSEWRGKPRRIRESVEGMGHVAAWAHLRGCAHYNSANVETLQAYAAGKAWQGRAVRLADAAAKSMQRAWKSFCEDYDAGAVVATIEPP
jgi:uncharacterized protein (DUF2252 family)